MTTLFGRFLWTIEQHIKSIRQFSFNNATFFEVIFIFIYALEQGGLILVMSWNPQNAMLIVSLFAIAVLTTFSIHKLFMLSRIKMLENYLNDFDTMYTETVHEAKRMQQSNEYLRQELISVLVNDQLSKKVK